MLGQCASNDIELTRTATKLPFIRDPHTHLEPSNEQFALRLLKFQVKILSENEEEKRSALEFERNSTMQAMSITLKI